MSDVAILAHDEYGASSAKRWTSCLGSVRLNAMCPPSQSSEWGDEGKLAHALLEVCLMFSERDASKYIGTTKVNDVEGTVTREMARAVQTALDYVFDLLDRHADAVLHVENRVKVPSSVVPDRMGGTFDIRIYVPSLKLLIVVDYKHGAGIYVDAEDNLQMRMYAIASMFTMSVPIEHVQTVIIQPRSWVANGTVRDDYMTPVDLITLHMWFEERAALTLDPNAPLSPSDDNCRWCPAGGYGVCPEARKTMAIVDEARSGALADPKRLSYEAMNFVLSNEKLIVAWIKNAKMTALGYAMRAGEFPGWKVVLGQAERAWDVKHHSEEYISSMLQLLTGLTDDEIRPRTLIGIVEAENAVVDRFRAGVSTIEGESKKANTLRLNEASRQAREAMAYLTLKEPRGAPRLAPLSDTRAALNTSALHIGGHINMEGL